MHRLLRLSHPRGGVTLACLLLAGLATGLHGLNARAESLAGAPFDLQGFIDTQLKAGKKRIVVPPGRYRVAPKQSVHLSFRNLTNVVIVATGVEMICTETARAINFENCHDVRFKGMTIDYDPLPFTEGRITALAPDKSWVEFEIIEGYPDNQLEQRIEIYDPATGELRREMTGWEEGFAPLGNHRYRISKPKSYGYRENWDTEQVGDILVTNQRSAAGTGDHAIVAARCTSLRLEEVTLYAAPCFGFLEHLCNGSTYYRCKIDRRPLAEDLVQRGFRRLRSLNADAFHSIEATKGPAIIQCTAHFQGDDCVNIHGTYHLVLASHQRLLSTQARVFKLTLDRPVPLPLGSGVCSGNRVGNGCRVEGCDFGYNRSRGILIKASHARVIGNTITHSWMAAVLVAPELFWWHEAASSSDVLIEGNTITGCRCPAIEVAAQGGNGKPLASGAHRDITITGNTIAQSVWPNIRAASTDGLVIRRNRLTPVEPERFVPPLPARWDWGTNLPAPILVESCNHPKVQSAVPRL